MLNFNFEFISYKAQRSRAHDATHTSVDKFDTVWTKIPVALGVPIYPAVVDFKCLKCYTINTISTRQLVVLRNETPMNIVLFDVNSSS